ncbi:hypothetical protein DNQ45_13130 [Escherichia coli]|uniref:Uncharacterized protein n=1 Tax=Escherichia coli TaxID=562 RepID=A0A2W6PCL2_ECOLX|nr:hypothetical protein DNQ45_13130 [Escherichia coli]
MSININDIINEAKNELEDLRVEGIKSAAYLELKSIFEEIKANPEIKTQIITLVFQNPVQVGRMVVYLTEKLVITRIQNHMY